MAPITREEIQRALKKAKSAKTPGLDGIPVEGLKKGKEHLEVLGLGETF